MAMHSTVGFSLSALGAWAVGVALDAAGGPQSAFGLDGGVLRCWRRAYCSARSRCTGREESRRSHEQSQLSIIVALGTTQTLAWASSYYLPAILADPIARDLGVSSNWIFAAFSASLVISAMLGPRIGRQIDLVGGRSGAVDFECHAGRGARSARPHHLDTGSARGMAAARHRHGRGTLRRRLRRARPHLRRRRPPLDHRHHPDRGLRLDGRMAADRVGAGDDRLAQHLLCVGRRAHPDRAADQLADAAAGRGRKGGHCRRRQAAHPARPHHDPAGVRLCSGLERHRRDGGASAAHSGTAGATIAAGGRGRRADRPGAGGGAHVRGELSSAAIIPCSRAGWHV